jgi:nicotinamidase-related amidase
MSTPDHPPRTLLDLAGAKRLPPDADASVLILIDIQGEYREGGLPLPDVDAAAGEAARLLARARARQVPVIHVVHHSRAGSALFAVDGPHVDILPEVAPKAGETTVTKALPNSFAGTDLAQVLERLGRRQLVLAGFMTHMCVSSTARAALDLGYSSTIVATATATRDLPGIAGKTISAATVGDVALAELADRFALVLADSSSLNW